MRKNLRNLTPESPGFPLGDFENKEAYVHDENRHDRKRRSTRIKDAKGVYQEVNADKFLAHIDIAKKEILAADSLVKVKGLWNRADAMRQLGQAAKDPELINFAMDFKL